MFPLKSDGMRGLAVFISDIRNCKSKEAEIKRINKELANIRSKFKGDKTFDGYQKKKYICKLLFIFLLGHDIDFGHMEAVNLLTSNKYSEKQIGYLFISVLMSYTSDLMRLVIQSIKNDLFSTNSMHVALALQCLSNIASKEMAEEFHHDVVHKLCSSDSIEAVKQCSSLCLLRFLRNSPEVITLRSWAPRLIQLLNDKDMGVVTSASSLIQALVQKSPSEYRSCIPIVVARLGRIVSSPSEDLQDYTYYFIPAPWLTIKLLKLLQSFIPSDIPLKMKLSEVLEKILNKSQEALKSRKVQHSNIKNAILFEAINLIIHLDHDPALMVRSCAILGNFLIHRETNLRYLALETLCLLASSEYCHHVVKKHQHTVVAALKNEKDISVRQKAVDMLYAMCNKTNVAQIVFEMLTYLEVADYSMREEMVLKVAILSEKYALDYTWYVDTILHLIKVAGDYVSEEVWYRVIQVITNREDVQGYAAKTVFESLQISPCHENMVKVGGYVLGEFGNLIAGDPRSSPPVQFSLLCSKFHSCSLPTQQLLLTTFVKFANLFQEIKPKILEIFKTDKLYRSSNVELQQRAVEYHQLISLASLDVLAVILEEMPPYPEKDSSILSKLKSKHPDNETSLSTPSPSKSLAVMKPMENVAASSVKQSLGQPICHQQTPRQQHQLIKNQFMQQHQHLTNNSIIPYPYDVTKFLFTNVGILFESDLIQIGVRSEYRQQNGRIVLYFGNKTNDQFVSFSSKIISTPSSKTNSRFKITSNPLEDTLNAKTQKQQLITVECLADFTEVPRLQLSFGHLGREYAVNVSLPILTNKFIKSSEMGAELFFARWHNLAEFESTFEKNYPSGMMPLKEKLAQKLTLFGLTCLPNVDHISTNLVSAGVLHTTSILCGVLLRLESLPQTQVIRLTIRTNRNGLSSRLCNLLGPQL